MTEAWHEFPSPGLITQADGSPFQWLNCAPATWAGLVAAQRQGHRPTKGSPWFPSGESLRNASGDRSGGIMPSTLDATCNRVYGEDLMPRITTTETAWTLLTRGYALGLLHGYGPIADAGLSCSPGFRGTHSSGMYGARVIPSTGEKQVLWADTLANGRRAGIFKGMRWIPWSVVVRAGYALVLDTSGETVLERYGSGHMYIVQTTVPYRPEAPLPAPLATLVAGAPADAEARRNVMIIAAYTVTSQRVKHLVKGQPLFASPGGHRVTSMSKAGTPAMVGRAGTGWDAVVIGTGVPYKDGEVRPTVLYVPAAAGAVVPR